MLLFFNKSAKEEINGRFDLKKTSLVPLGNKGLVYGDLVVCASWAPHNADAYCVGPALKHYHCLQFYMLDTRLCQMAI